MFCEFNNVRLSAVNFCIAPIEINIEDEAEYYGGSLKKIARLRKAIGLDRRRICPPGVTASDLCFQAAQELLESDKIKKGDIDALLFLSQTPDYPMPATASILQDRLGLSQECAAIDLSQGCSGYIYGLWMAASLVASGSCGTVLLLVGDAFPPPNLANRVVTPIFGEGGSASLLCRDEKGGRMAFDLFSDGSGHEMIIRPAGGARRPFSLKHEDDAVLYENIVDSEGNPWSLAQPYMNGRAVFDFSQNVVPEHIRAFLKKVNMTPEQIDRIFLHQANCQIVELVAEKAGFQPDPGLSAAFRKYGNLTCASIPAAICEALGGSAQREGWMLCCGFGVGLSWGSSLIDMAGLKVGKIAEYKGRIPENYEREYVDHWQNVFRGIKND